MIGFLISIFVSILLFHWLREKFPRSTGAAGTMAKGAWGLTKGTARLTHRGVVEAADLYAATREEVRCPHCNTKFPAIGVATCTRCGRRLRRRFFAPCTCGHRVEYVHCPSCGLAVDAPLLWLRPKHQADHASGTGHHGNHRHRRRP